MKLLVHAMGAGKALRSRVKTAYWHDRYNHSMEELQLQSPLDSLPCDAFQDIFVYSILNMAPNVHGEVLEGFYVSL